MGTKLPKGWVETEFDTIIEFVIGGDWGKDAEFIDDDFRDVLCIRGSEIKNWIKDKGNTSSKRRIKYTSLEKRKLKLGDILVEISGGGPDQPVGRTVLIDKDVLDYDRNTPKVCTNFFRMVRLFSKVNSEFVNHYLQYFYKTGEVANYQGGSNNLRNLRFPEYATIKIPLPPLAEQKRIVSKLDSIFGHLESLKTRLEHIPALLKDFRQSVLTQTVTGKLTNSVSEYDLYFLNDVCDEFKYGSSSKSLAEGDVPVLRMGNLQNGKIDYSDLKFSSNKEEIKKYKLVKGDILFNRTNSPELVGKTSLFDGKIDSIYAGYLIKVKCSNKILPEYLNFVMNSPYAKEWCWSVKSDGVSQSNINAQKLKSFSIPLPKLKEQTEIVNQVESLFAKADNIEAQYQTLKQKIDNLPQAILAKAFKGELVEQLDSDGSAADLLAEILALKAALGGMKKTKGKKRKPKKYNIGIEQSLVAEKEDGYIG